MTRKGGTEGPSATKDSRGEGKEKEAHPGGEIETHSPRKATPPCAEHEYGAGKAAKIRKGE